MKASARPFCHSHNYSTHPESQNFQPACTTSFKQKLVQYSMRTKYTYTRARLYNSVPRALFLTHMVLNFLRSSAPSLIFIIQGIKKRSSFLSPFASSMFPLFLSLCNSFLPSTGRSIWFSFCLCHTGVKSANGGARKTLQILYNFKSWASEAPHRVPLSHCWHTHCSYCSNRLLIVWVCITILTKGTLMWETATGGVPTVLCCQARYTDKTDFRWEYVFVFRCSIFILLSVVVAHVPLTSWC